MNPTERIDEACHRLLTDPALKPLLAWWEGEALRSKMPAGPVDPMRLAMAQGDRERLLAVMQRASQHVARKE
jgi:hypothetical protein